LFPPLILLSILILARGALAAVTLNEVLYDPEGADGGREFVELHNDGDRVCLAGWRLQFANGAVGDIWANRWTGAAIDTIPAGGFYLIVDQGWQGRTPDAVASLSLQNGPDAVRLLDGEMIADRLGYGALELPALYEGTPHPGATGGGSLARRPDGRDTDENAVDWAILSEPTPGLPNYPPFGLETISFAAEPPSLARAGDQVRIALEVVNAGVDTLPVAVLTLSDADGITLADTVTGALAPEASVGVAFTWRPLGDGVFDLHLGWPLDDGGVLTVPAGGYRCGLAPLVLTEVMAGPAPGACEWVEVAAAGVTNVDLAAYSLVDEGGAPSALPARILQAGERLILVQDVDVYLDWWREQQGNGSPWSCPVVHPDFNAAELSGAWPTLNNTPPDGRDFADRVHLLDQEGIVVDHVTLGWAGAEVMIGRSLERSGLLPAGSDLSLWGSCTAMVGATPGCANSLEATAFTGGALVVTRTGPEGAVLFSFELSGKEYGWRLEIYDLTGFRLRDLGGDSLGVGPRRVIWDGRDEAGRMPPPEALVALLVILGNDGARVRTHKSLVVTTAASGS
jgi:hypothetical protein